MFVQVCSSLQKQLRLLHSSVGDLVLYAHSRDCEGFITNRYLVYCICLCYSHKIRYIIIWYLSSKSL